MKNAKFTETQIVFVIRQARQGVRVEKINRKMELIEQHFTIGKGSMEA